MKPRDMSGFLTGLAFAAIGVAFVLEAEGVWTFRLTELSVVVPVLLILGGLAILVLAIRRTPRLDGPDQPASELPLPTADPPDESKPQPKWRSE